MSLFMINGAVAQINALGLGLISDQIGLENLLPLSAFLCTVLVLLLVALVPTVRNLGRRVEIPA